MNVGDNDGRTVIGPEGRSLRETSRHSVANTVDFTT